MKNRLEDAANVSGLAPTYVIISEDYTNDPNVVISYKHVLTRCSNSYYGSMKTKTDIFKNLSTKQVNHLAQQFEMRKAADIYSRRQISKSGLIDVNKVAQYKIKDDIFKRNIKTPNGQNHGMIMLLDWSGSMRHSESKYGTQIRNSLDQVQMLVMFCRKVNIPYRVYAFASPVSMSSFPRPMVNQRQNHKSNELSLIELFSNNMTLSEHNTMMDFSINGIIERKFDMCSTPLAPALLYMRKLIPEFKAETKVQKVNLITFTDGENNTHITSRHNDGGLYITDKVTKRNYCVSTGQRASDTAIQEVNVIYQMLKDRFGITIISFFIGPAKALGEAAYYSGRIEDGHNYVIRVRDEYLANGFVKMTGYGRDAIYLVNTQLLVNKGIDLKTIDSNMTSKKIASILTKTGKASLKGKVLIEKFVEVIA